MGQSRQQESLTPPHDPTKCGLGASMQACLATSVQPETQGEAPETPQAQQPNYLAEGQIQP
eukprot:1156090-Pelagomonas_calceolata.AAC.6